jgi:hypothetical protein
MQFIKTNSALNDIKIQNREYIISKLETGDLIKLQAEVLPIIFHFGIIEKQGNELYIYHNQTDKINPSGGSLVCEPLEKFIIGRDILEVTKTNLNSTDLSKMYNTLKNLRYHFVFNNCEHFVNFATIKKPVSSQVYKWVTIIGISALAYYLIKNKK